MFCNNCGEKILNGALFCAACGCKVDPVLRSDTDNKLKTNDDLQPFEVKLDPVNQQLAEQDKKSAEIDHQPVANEIKPDDKVQTTVVSNRQPSENKQTFSDDEQRTRIYYGDNGVNNNNYSSKSIFDQPAMSGGNVAVVKKKNDNIYIIVAFIAGCVVISLLAYLLIFVNTCKQSPIEGTWFNKSGKMIRFEKNGEFTWEDKYGTYTIDNDSFLSLYFRNNSDFGKSKTYIFDNEAIYSSGDYWHISGNSLYISGEEYTKHQQPVSSVLLVLILTAFAAAFIAGPILLIIQIVKKRKNTGLSKGDFPYGTWKKTLIFFSAPLTIIAIAAIITLTFI